MIYMTYVLQAELNFLFFFVGRLFITKCCILILCKESCQEN